MGCGLSRACRLQEIIGAAIPITISVDLHGIMTAKMLTHVDGLCPLHTYPHIDAGDAGARAARLLLQLLDGEVARTKNLRISIPLLCRGNEMITEPHAAGADSYIGEVMRQAVAMEHDDPAVLAAGVYWGNPFTGVGNASRIASHPTILQSTLPPHCL